MRRFLHVGYPKAASTFLQDYIFPHHPQIHYVGRSGGDNYTDPVFQRVIWMHMLDQQAPNYDRAEMRAILPNYLRAHQWSDEIQYFGMSSEQIMFSYLGQVDMEERVKRVHDFIGSGAKIILIIREQLSWIQSMYGTLIKEFGLALNFQEFLLHFFHDKDRSGFYWLCYDRAYALYGKYFGKENIHIVPYRSIHASPEAFIDGITEFLGIDPLKDFRKDKTNTSSNGKELSYLLNCNIAHRFGFGAGGFVFRDYLNAVDASSPPLAEGMAALRVEKQAALFARYAENIKPIAPELLIDMPEMDLTINAADFPESLDIYRRSNHRLMEMTGLDLLPYGYLL